MFEAYKVAVRLSLINNVSSGLLLMAGQFQGLNRHINTTTANVNALERQMLQLKRLGLVGGALAAVGGAGLAAFKAPLEEAKLWQLEVEKFRALGVGDVVTRDASKFAEGMKSYGTSMRENLGLLRDAQTIFGDFEHAKLVTPLLSQMKFANAAMYGSEGGAMRDRSFMDMLKVIELRKGLVSEAAFKSQANMVQQVQTATGGRVGASEYLNLIKTGGVAAKGLKDDVFYYKMEPLIQEMGGNRIGTGLMSAYNNLILGRTTVQTAKELERLGLLDPKHVEYNKIGMIKRIQPGGLKEGDQMMADPIAYLENVMLPAFRAKGITSEQDTLRELGLVFSNRTASQLFSTIYLQMENIKKNEALNKGAMGIDQLDKTAKNTAIGKEMELHSRWKDVLKELGTSVLPIAIRAVEGLTTVVKGMVNFAREWPRLTQWLVVGFGVLAAIVAAGGTLALATAGFKALGLALAAGGAAGGVGGLLGGTATGLGLVAKAAGVFMAAYAGWQAGGWLNDNAINPAVKKLTGGKEDSVGSWLYNRTHADVTDEKGMVSSKFAWWRMLPGGDFVEKYVGSSKPQAGNRQTVAIPSPSADAPRPVVAMPGRQPSQPASSGSNYVAPRQQQPIQVTSSINLDGRKVAEVVTDHQYRDAQRPAAGVSRFDGGMTPAMAGSSGR